MSDQRFTNGQVARIPVSIIRCDGGTQVRAGINSDSLERYIRLVEVTKAEAIDSSGANDNWLDNFESPLPPVDVFYDGSEFWMADGYTRLAVHKSIGIPIIAATIHLGTVREARYFATGANKHGQPMTDADRRRAARILLEDDEWSGVSDREIERRTGYGRASVAKLRTELLIHISDDENDTQPNKRKVIRGGKEYEIDTSNVKAANSSRKRKAEVEKIRAQVPELADAVERKELSPEQAQIIIAERGNAQVLEPASEVWYATLPIWRDSSGNPELQSLIERDINAWRTLQNLGVFTGIAAAANTAFDYNGGGTETVFSQAIKSVAYYPHPKDWKLEDYDT